MSARITEHWQHWTPSGEFEPRTTVLTDDDIDEQITAAVQERRRAAADATTNAAAGWRAEWIAALTTLRDACGGGFSRTHHAHWATRAIPDPAAEDWRWAPLVVTSTTTDAEIAGLVDATVARRVADAHADTERHLAAQAAAWREELAQLG